MQIEEQQNELIEEMQKSNLSEDEEDNIKQEQKVQTNSNSKKALPKKKIAKRGQKAVKINHNENVHQTKFAEDENTESVPIMTRPKRKAASKQTIVDLSDSLEEEEHKTPGGIKVKAAEEDADSSATDDGKGKTKKLQKQRSLSKKKGRQGQQQIQNQQQLGKGAKKAGNAKASKAQQQQQKQQQPKESLESRIIEYFRTQNRPYSAQNIFDNLRLEKTKEKTLPKLKLLLQEMTENKDGPLVVKEYGANKIYNYNQAMLEQPDSNELRALQDQLAEMEAALRELKAEEQKLSTQLKTVRNQPTNTQIEIDLQSLQETCSINEQTIQRLQVGGAMEQVTDEQIKFSETKLEKMKKESRWRKNVCMEMVGDIAEGMEKKPKEVMELLNMEEVVEELLKH